MRPRTTGTRLKVSIHTWHHGNEQVFPQAPLSTSFNEENHRLLARLEHISPTILGTIQICQKHLFDFYPKYNDAIITKFCTCHDSTAVMTSAKNCNDMMGRNIITVESYLQFWWKMVTPIGARSGKLLEEERPSTPCGLGWTHCNSPSVTRLWFNYISGDQ